MEPRLVIEVGDEGQCEECLHGLLAWEFLATLGL
jgi:hypothetical protein